MWVKGVGFIIVYPDRMQCDRIGRGKRQKAWKQEIRRELKEVPWPDCTEAKGDI